MLTFFSEDSHLRQARTELHDGTLVTPFECPERLDLVLKQLRKSGLGDIRAPAAYGLAPVLAACLHCRGPLAASDSQTRSTRSAAAS